MEKFKMKMLELMESRHSVRQYFDRPVRKEKEK